MRDGSAHVLRCLKVWYDLPSDVFHTALANIDTFLAKMKVNKILMTFYTFMLPSLPCNINHSIIKDTCSSAHAIQLCFSFSKIVCLK